jgi:hypothetical protein
MVTMVVHSADSRSVPWELNSPRAVEEASFGRPAGRSSIGKLDRSE